MEKVNTDKLFFFERLVFFFDNLEEQENVTISNTRNTTPAHA